MACKVKKRKPLKNNIEKNKNTIKSVLFLFGSLNLCSIIAKAAIRVITKIVRKCNLSDKFKEFWMGKIPSVTYLLPTVVNRDPTISPIFSSEFSLGYKRLVIARMKASRRVKNNLKYKFIAFLVILNSRDTVGYEIDSLEVMLPKFDP